MSDTTLASLGSLGRPMLALPSHFPNGMVVPPTMDPSQQPNAINPNGDISTIRTIGINVDGLETVIPTVSQDGRLLTEAQAIQEFKRTGRHLGMFRTEQQADIYSQQLHNFEAHRLGPVPVMRPVASHNTLGTLGNLANLGQLR